METNKLLSVIAVLALLMALANLFVTLVKVGELKSLTGYDIYGAVNLTIEQSIQINFSTNTLNFGSGLVDTGQSNATIYSRGSGLVSVARGNWSTTSKNLVLDNIGNINCSVTLGAAKTAATLFGGAAAQQLYRWNVSNKDSQSCSSWDVAALNSAWLDVNTSTKFCKQLGFNSGARSLYVDIWLTIPASAVSVGAQSDTITATASAAT